ncbi:transcriptional regulator, LacI family [Mucilaginibacter pineti]|uniref:Transcriptional regulator, LacI family n=1 Tax=Mucilaginibacter pineti TaxID=1391627 RepID=A0A1G6STB6_9SPHI|nr:LacI family DNA-binding transcriptional regulator [Mucilaginibacter pineti]SDD20028.1 transcriptional regulator, LacI family [Mucilaginibacter pineti]
MKKKRVSIKDIAAQLNISITTVSFILNGKSKEVGISTALTEKVLKHVEETGYKPNLLAKSLRTGKTKIICLLIENIADPFFATVAGYVEELFNQRGYKIIFGSTKNQAAKTRELIDLFRDRHVDGFIIAPSEKLEADITNLLNESIPLVLFDRYYKEIETDRVTTDNYEGAYNAVKLLIDQDYRNIALITIDSEQTQMHDRLLGYEKAISEYGLKPYTVKMNYQKVEQTAVEEITQLLTQNPDIDALFFGTNYLTLKGLQAIEELNLSVPGDIGVISFDDHDVFKLLKPNITAVAQPIAKMSEEMVNLLLEQIDVTKAERTKRQVVVPSTMHVRDSSIKKINHNA